MKKFLVIIAALVITAIPLSAQQQTETAAKPQSDLPAQKQQPQTFDEKVTLFLGFRYGLLNVHGTIEEIANDADSSTFNRTKSNSVTDVEIGIETKGVHRFGVKSGFEYFFKNSLASKSNPSKLEENAYMVPLTAYYKFAPRDTGLHFWAGAGFTVALADVSFWDSTGNFNKYYDNKIFLQAVGGIDYRFSSWFALGVDFGYNFFAKMKSFENTNEVPLTSVTNTDNGKNYPYYQDYSGFKGGLSAKFFF